ncbi:hypothetical protein G6F57_012158 [Rhizopus arrhizus]|uniref:Uncharacterized protein n=1 Tax=Rhizopus oryzae TaxID=64495 RepID=A0A9P6X681_RHIOR|nr:hypothetical protein G6F23_009492 [Rhizopus arrhizus]KAG1398190.1 hypothetical protein G6F58_011374 [Rhizopus delemar]KAG0755480.1 hypothetical protein G6F24_011806 [Rhizopus arrhizus]KAG0778935.1 hypothetical protein G6F22_010933 [Rhizopus arrhizus]KAG0787179.1 hypothetical protein G6F21_008087 [Rhizopus arrhizus]
MGCCMSYEKSSTIEVVLDENGVAHRVAEGEGTHIIRTYPDKETKIEKKPHSIKSSELSKPEATFYPKRSLMTTTRCFPTKKVRPGEVIDMKRVEQEKL